MDFDCNVNLYEKRCEVEAVLLCQKNIKEVIEWIYKSGGYAEYHENDKDLFIRDALGFLSKAELDKHFIVKACNNHFFTVNKEIFDELYEPVVPF